MEFLLFQASSLYSPGDETSIQQWKIPIYRFIMIYRQVIDMFFFSFKMPIYRGILWISILEGHISKGFP